MRWNNCVVDDTDGTDYWCRRTVGGRSVTADVSHRSNQTLNWMCWAYRSSDSSRQCHSVANSTADRLTVFVSRLIHSTHCTNSELGVSPRFTALSIFIQQRLTWKVSRNRPPPLWTQQWSRDLQSRGSKQVKPGRKLGRRRAKAARLRRAAYVYTGTNSNWYK